VPLGVYIAAPFPLRNHGTLARSGLLSMGLISTAHWLDVEKEEWNDEWARIDLADIDRATVFLLINPPEWRQEGTGGRHVEFGYAVARHKDIVIWGERTNLFHSLSHIQVAGDLPSAINMVNDLARGLSLDV
jgi:nucleoside 2-deoxyribosyltransferase